MAGFTRICARLQGVAVIGSQQCFIWRKQVVHSGDIICEGIIRIQKEPAKAELPREELPAAQNTVEAEPVRDPAAQPMPIADGKDRKAIKPKPKQEDSAKAMTKVWGPDSECLHTKAVWCKGCLQ